MIWVGEKPSLWSWNRFKPGFKPVSNWDRSSSNWNLEAPKTDSSSTFSKRQTEATVLLTSTAMVVKAPVCPPNYFTCLSSRAAPAAIGRKQFRLRLRNHLKVSYVFLRTYWLLTVKFVLNKQRIVKYCWDSGYSRGPGLVVDVKWGRPRFQPTKAKKTWCVIFFFLLSPAFGENWSWG